MKTIKFTTESMFRSLDCAKVVIDSLGNEWKVTKGSALFIAHYCNWNYIAHLNLPKDKLDEWKLHIDRQTWLIHNLYKEYNEIKNSNNEEYKSIVNVLRKELYRSNRLEYKRFKDIAVNIKNKWATKYYKDYFIKKSNHVNKYDILNATKFVELYLE